MPMGIRLSPALSVRQQEVNITRGRQHRGQAGRENGG